MGLDLSMWHTCSSGRMWSSQSAVSATSQQCSVYRPCRIYSAAMCRWWESSEEWHAFIAQLTHWVKSFSHSGAVFTILYCLTAPIQPHVVRALSYEQTDLFSSYPLTLWPTYCYCKISEISVYQEDRADEKSSQERDPPLKTKHLQPTTRLI